MEQTLLLEGRTFSLLGAQRGGALVYRGTSEYLRIGPKAAIKRDLACHRSMERAHYPVAEVVAEGELGDQAYFIEKSIGHQSFRTMFAEDYAKEREINATSFEKLLALSARFLQAQIEAKTSDFKEDEVREGIRLAQLQSEMPELAELLEKRFTKAMQKLRAFPGTMTHGDLNPSNMYPEGVIDLEDSFIGPLGFDSISIVCTQDWYPKEGDYEFVGRYFFSSDQKEEFVASMDAIAKKASLPSIREAYEEYEFLRSVWLCAGMGQWPKTQEWRFNKMSALVQK